MVRAPPACDKEKQPVLGAKAARDAALGEAADAQGRCKALESELQGLQDQLAEEVHIRQEKKKT